MRNYKKIQAWELSHELTIAVYEASKGFPADERFGLTSQLRRAASSVPANIAEGSGRKTEKDFVHFLDIALGSLKETEYFLLLATELGYLAESQSAELNGLEEKAIRCLVAYIKAIRS